MPMSWQGVTAAIALVVAAVALIVKLTICVSGCSVESIYSHIFGIPTECFGLLIVCILAAGEARKSHPRVREIQLLIGSLAVGASIGFVVYMLYISYWCVYCAMYHSAICFWFMLSTRGCIGRSRIFIATTSFVVTATILISLSAGDKSGQRPQEVNISIRESHGLAFNTENTIAVMRVFLGVTCSSCKRLSPEILGVLSRRIGDGTCVIIYLVDDSDPIAVRQVWRASSAGGGMKTLVRHYTGDLSAGYTVDIARDSEYDDYVKRDLSMAQFYGVQSVPTIVVSVHGADTVYRLDDIKQLVTPE
jgi:hypothetical protein